MRAGPVEDCEGTSGTVPRPARTAPQRTLGFLGPAGTFTEGAARVYAAAPDCAGSAGKRLVPYDDIPELLQAVARAEVDEAVAPVENSIEGTVNATVDTLVHDVELTIVADVVLPIRHHLLMPPGTELRLIRTVVSHPQALAQCRRWLAQNLPGVRVEAALSTAAAADKANREKTPYVAAIGNSLSAELYGLTMAAQNIQDEATNETRFFVVRRQQPTPRPAAPLYKTSIAFAFAADGPGNLYGALGEFARYDVNLTKLESRPARQALGHYIFFVDMDGHVDDDPVTRALNALRQECTFVKVLGSYRRITV